MHCHFLAIGVEHPASHCLLRLSAPRAHPRLGRCSHHLNVGDKCPQIGAFMMYVM